MADLESLLQKIQNNDPNTRTEGWLSAGEVGAPALKPLAELAVKGELEVGRAAQRAMWKIVRHVGHPTAAAEQKQAVIAELTDLLAKERPPAVRREALWMLSEIAGDESVDRIASILDDNELREDTRMVLERIPGQKSLAALQAALARTSDDFKHNLAQSLRVRGVEVPDVPCRKLVPTR